MAKYLYNLKQYFCFSLKVKPTAVFRQAFTLAEVLITLTIIGVVAAVTIPTLIHKDFEQEMIAKLKKNYSVLSNAFTQAIRENGPIDEWEIGPNAQFEGAEKMFNYIKPYLKIQKDCGMEGGCFGESYKALFNNDECSYKEVNTQSSRYKFVLSDGTSVATFSTNKGCYDMRGQNHVYDRECGDIWVDLNNSKGPNRVGVDMFRFAITRDKLVPSGLGYKQLILEENGNQCTFQNTNKRNGANCTMHVLYKGNMNYLKDTIESDWQNYFNDGNEE